MATSAAQTYIARLGFQDPDRKQDRHGLACEYLFERMVELEVAPRALKWETDRMAATISSAQERLHGYIEDAEKMRCFDECKCKALRECFEKLQNEQALFDKDAFLSRHVGEIKAGQCINVPIVSDSYRSSFVNGFADVLIDDPYTGRFLGEVKISKEPPEQVLQQINFYLSYLNRPAETTAVYIVTDYEPGDLKRLCLGTKIKVYRLGQVFENWLAARTTPATEEL
jgi:hypothetical protein